MSEPIISLIIPIYNVAKFLSQTLNSVQKQTFRNFEAICINDGSSDNSLEIIKEYTENDERFKLIDQNNKGVSFARNKGLKIAKGKYIMFLDGDDFLHPQAMEIAVAAITKSDADICQFGLEEVFPEEKVEFVSQIMTKPVIMKNVRSQYLDNRNMEKVLIWNKIYKAETAKAVDFYSLHPREDDIYSFEVLLNVNSFAQIDNQLVYYVQNPHSIMHTIDDKVSLNTMLDADEVINKISVQYLKTHNDPIFEESYKHFMYDHERKFFKYTIVKLLEKGDNYSLVIKNFDRYLKRVNEGMCYFSALKLKHKLIFRLLRGKHYFLARMVANT